MKAKLEVVAIVMLILASGAVIALALRSFLAPPTSAAGDPPNSVRPPVPKERIELRGATTRGNATARVVMVEYSDFKCSYCGRFARETMPSLVKRYVDTGKLLIVFRHLPIQGIASDALRAAEAASCAGTAGRFWEMHDVLFLNPTRLDEGSLREHARAAGLDQAAFGKCLSDADGSRVQQDVAEAKALGIKMTPTFLIGFKVSEHEMKAALRLDGARPLAEFVKALDRATMPASGRQP